MIGFVLIGHEPWAASIHAVSGQDFRRLRDVGHRQTRPLQLRLEVFQVV